MRISQMIPMFLTLCVSLGALKAPYYNNVNQQAGELAYLPFNELRIPLFLPVPLPISNTETDTKIQYYFDAKISEESYCIDIYNLAEVDPSDKAPDPARLPLSGRLGQISGLRAPQTGSFCDSENWGGQGITRKELIPNIYAQTGENGTFVKWKDAGWEFEFSGSSGRWSELQQFAARWRQITPVAPQGTVRIYQKSVFFMWDDANCHYCYETYQMDLFSALSVFDSIRKALPVDQP